MLMRVVLWSAMLTAACACAGERTAPRRDLRIAVFDQLAARGEGLSVDGMLAGLRSAGYSVERISDLTPLGLLACDIVYLCDMHKPGQVDPKWRENLRRYVESGGSVLQSWHHHVLGEVGVGVLRVNGKPKIRVRSGHPAVEGLGDFEASYPDHIVERAGRGATVLLENEQGQPVAVAGTLGRGKVISTGLALGVQRRGTAFPRGAERKLLEAFLAWLAPAVPRNERIAAGLQEPQIGVEPGRIVTAAGLTASFRVLVGAKNAGLVQVAADDPRATVAADPGRDLGSDLLRAMVVHVPTPAGRSTRRSVTIEARVGDAAVRRSVELETIDAPAPAHERRGVWLHVGMDRQPAEVMPELARLGLNMVVLRIAGGTAAFYASKVQPDVQDPLAPGGDWLAEAVQHAHANRLELHAYVNNCIVEGRSSKETLARLRAEGRLQEGLDGMPIDWFCPSQPVNIEAIERPMLEIASRYAVDGIQYDFIRYPNAAACFCAKCRARFEAESGRPVAPWPADVVDGPRHAEWVEFRCRRISELVERISSQIRRIAPRVKISAAVFRNWPECRETNGQDWARWCKEGWLDFVCPMNYTLSPEEFARRAAIHRQAAPAGFPIVQGIGISAGTGQMESPEQLAVQMAAARQSGAAGFLGFAYRPEHTSRLFAPLGAILRNPPGANSALPAK